MRSIIKHYLLLTTGWLFVILGVIGAFVPLLPTTPFLIVALGCFANSSPRFHGMLLNNKWVGPPLAQWERNHTIRRAVKFKAMALIITTFTVSILVLHGRVGLQLMLVCLCLVLLAFVWRLKEAEDN